MSKKIKTMIAAGGTGGHVFPGCSLADHLIKNNYEVEIITDKRGYFFLEKFKNYRINILPSTPIIQKNILSFIISIFFLAYSILRCFIFLLFKRPRIIFGMGGYSSFPVCLAAKILNIKFIIYENNLIIGKANKYLLPFATKLLVAYKEIEGIDEKYKYKIREIGNIIRENIINYPKENYISRNIEKLNILIIGGSQAAKIFAEVLPMIFKECNDKIIPIKIYQQCLPEQTDNLKSFYEGAKIDFEIFNFSPNLQKFFSKIDLALTRSGASMQAEFVNANIPFITIPLPSSADNHQFKNASFYENKKFCFLIEEKDLKQKLKPLINLIYKNNSLLLEIRNNQRQYSDKKVYKNITKEMEITFNEKN